jgi:Transposase and inactivated derivatives
MIVFPIQSFMDYESCYSYLQKLLHPEGLHCPCGHKVSPTQKAHKYRANGLPCYRCVDCKKVFNLFTDTILSGIHYNCILIVLMLRGFAQGKTTQHLSKELKLSYNNLLNWRHKLQELAFENRNWSALEDKEIESDEVFINAGEKGEKHEDPDDPPRVRANKKKA